MSGQGPCQLDRLSTRERAANLIKRVFAQQALQRLLWGGAGLISAAFMQKIQVEATGRSSVRRMQQMSWKRRRRKTVTSTTMSGEPIAIEQLCMCMTTHRYENL